MLAKIAYYTIFGKPFIMYLGLLTLLLLLVTATLGAMIYKGKNIPVRTHKTIAGLAILIGLIHAILSFGALMGL